MNTRSDSPRDPEVAALGQRDRQGAMTLVVRRHEARLLRRARGILKDDDLARDAVQEVFIRAWREPRFFDPTFHRAAWLYRVTTNLCFNRVRDRRRREDILATRPPKEPSPPSQADAVQQTQRARVFATALAQLTEDHRAVLHERYVHDRSYQEIADVLGLKLGTVMSRLARARAALATVLPHALVPDL